MWEPCHDVRQSPCIGQGLEILAVGERTAYHSRECGGVKVDSRAIVVFVHVITEFCKAPKNTSSPHFSMWSHADHLQGGFVYMLLQVLLLYRKVVRKYSGPTSAQGIGFMM